MSLDYTSEQTQTFQFIDLQVLQALEELSSSGDDSLIPELVQIFKDTTPPLFEEIDHAINAKEVTKLTRLAHRIKGSASNIGAKKIADICSELERNAHKNTVSENSNLLKDLQLSFHASCHELSNWISQNIQ